MSQAFRQDKDTKPTRMTAFELVFTFTSSSFGFVLLFFLLLFSNHIVFAWLLAAVAVAPAPHWLFAGRLPHVVGIPNTWIHIDPYTTFPPN